ncbi:hypothetical protein Tcan_00202 [Toxocara canis]|uniref:Uncharacterized protein n=1 Tax=Toxocara canis TaxID=6265 RepID=A0A0B2V278_TOXCA|nr:hypothetical protein Tcan_00202 [Toxocara canis]
MKCQLHTYSYDRSHATMKRTAMAKRALLYRNHSIMKSVRDSQNEKEPACENECAVCRRDFNTETAKARGNRLGSSASDWPRSCSATICRKHFSNALYRAPKPDRQGEPSCRHQIRL